MRRHEDGFVGVGRSRAVAALRLVGVRAPLVREHPGVRPEAHHLVTQPAVVELVEQCVRGGHELSWLSGLRGGDRLRELRRPEVRIDDAVDVLPELEPEPQVALRDGLVHACEPRASAGPLAAAGRTEPLRSRGGGAPRARAESAPKWR